ncbi:hypothetical protein BBJ28_00020452 [Nothophytophthora sp. Chile5]|nr:hypothetical protein BBJ28_00020452 [Nothophytophthora sp. Chile5]
MEEKLGEKIDVLMTQMTRMSQQLQKQNEIIAKHVVAVPPALHCSPSDANVTLEWLLKTNAADDAPWSRPVAGPQIYLNAAMPYFEVADEPCHGMETDLSSVLSAPPPTPSSDVNPVELVTSSLPFGEM